MKDHLIFLTDREIKQLVAALDSHIRRMIRDYKHKDRLGADIGNLQERQARIMAAQELREKIKRKGLY
jgi:hypothetical protein